MHLLRTLVYQLIMSRDKEVLEKKRKSTQQQPKQAEKPGGMYLPWVLISVHQRGSKEEIQVLGKIRTTSWLVWKRKKTRLYKPLPESVTQACHRVFYLVLGVKRLCQPHSCGLINWNQTQTSKRLRKQPWMWRNVCCLRLFVICTCVFLHSDQIRKHISLSWIISCT